MPAQKDYKERHDNIARILHLELFQKFGLFDRVKWYNHKPASVDENDRFKIMWYFLIKTDHVIHRRRPDISMLYSTQKIVTLLILLYMGTKGLS